MLRPALQKFCTCVPRLGGSIEEKLTRVNHRQEFALRGISEDRIMALEQTYIMIKPDGVQRSLVGEIIKRFEQKGYYLRGLKYKNVEKELAEEHYVDLSSKPFYSGLVEYIISAPVVAMVWEGKDVVKTGRAIIGATNPLAADPGSIRGQYAIDVGRNIIHGSDSVESAKREIALWFPEGLAEYKPHIGPWIYEKF